LKTYNEDLKPQKVVLKFHKEIAEVVAERIWHTSQKIKHHRDGSLTLEMRVVISDELRSWVGSWLEYVEVIKPKGYLRMPLYAGYYLGLNQNTKKQIMNCINVQ